MDSNPDPTNTEHVNAPSSDAPVPPPPAPTDPQPTPQPPAPAPANPYAVPQQPMPAAPQPPVPGGYAPAPGSIPVPAPGENVEKNYLLAIAFSFLLGAFGVDRFYLGYIVTGILKLITFGGFGIWHFIDLMLIAFGKLKEKGNPAPLEGYTKYHSSIKPVAIFLLVLDVILIVGFFFLFIVGILFGALASQQNLNNANVQNIPLQSQSTNLYSN